jgi:hypothetical protein
MASGHKAPPILETSGIRSDSPIIASPEEAERLEQLEREQTNARIVTLDGVLSQMWSCACCHQPNVAAFERDALCPECRMVITRIRAERLCAELVDGQSRAEWADSYIARTASS